MTDPCRRQPSAADAARSDSPPSPPVERQLPEFQPAPPSPYSPIEREIERSERALAALAAARALARASFTDSELAADDDAGPHDFETGSWTRTEYAPLDHSVCSDDDERAAAPRNLLGGTFNPGIAAQQGRRFPGASIAQAPIRTRSGAHARFAQESRQTPRPGRPADAATSAMPMPASALGDRFAVGARPAPDAAAAIAARPRAPAHPNARAPVELALAAALVAAIVAIGGGLAWNAGLLARSNPDNSAMVTPAVVAEAEAARVLSAQQDIPIAPAAGVPSQRSDEEIDAALAAAARAAAVPTASVRAAAAPVVARPSTMGVAPAPAVPAASAGRHPAPRGKDGVAEAVVNAQARADRFLATDGARGAVVAPRPTEAASGP